MPSRRSQEHPKCFCRLATGLHLTLPAAFHGYFRSFVVVCGVSFCLVLVICVLRLARFRSALALRCLLLLGIAPLLHSLLHCFVCVLALLWLRFLLSVFALVGPCPFIGKTFVTALWRSKRVSPTHWQLENGCLLLCFARFAVSAFTVHWLSMFFV